MHRAVHRITPAYAGKSFFFDPPVSLSWDHPRVCGEKIRSCFSVVWPVGSPPRMRGKAEYFMPEVDDMGITPAYAGKSQVDIVFIMADGDHPRVCGEKRAPHCQRDREAGSPPRMRGKD